MEKYMIGDEFGNMYNDTSDEFFCNRGTLYSTKDFAEKKMNEISKRKEYENHDWKFKIWTVTLK